MLFKYALISASALALPANALPAAAPAPPTEGKPIPVYTETQTAFIKYSAGSKFHIDTKIIWDPENHPSKATAHAVTMDTGSTAITYEWKFLSDTLKAKRDEYEVGYKFLSSSSVLYTGYWVPVTVEFGGAAEGTVVAEVEILATVYSNKCKTWKAADGAKCVDKDGKATMVPVGGKQPPATSSKLKKRAYMGVGFGREGDGMAQCTPDRNPMLNIKSIGGKAVDPSKYRQGYIVTKQGIHLGLTKANTAGFKKAQQLDLRPNNHGPMDWDQPKMCVTVTEPGKPTPKCLNGRFLADTGISHMYLRIDDTVITKDKTTEFTDQYDNQSQDLQNGYKVSISLGGAGSIEFTKGQPTGLSPKRVFTKWKTTFWTNTGNTFYNQYDAMFDAKAGLFAIRAHA